MAPIKPLTRREILDMAKHVHIETLAKAAIEEIYDKIKVNYPDYNVKEYRSCGYRGYQISSSTPILQRGFFGVKKMNTKEKVIVIVNAQYNGTKELSVHVNDSELIEICKEVIKTPNPNDQGLTLCIRLEEESEDKPKYHSKHNLGPN